MRAARDATVAAPPAPPGGGAPAAVPAAPRAAAEAPELPDALLRPASGPPALLAPPPAAGASELLLLLPLQVSSSLLLLPPLLLELLLLLLPLPCPPPARLLGAGAGRGAAERASRRAARYSRSCALSELVKAAMAFSRCATVSLVSRCQRAAAAACAAPAESASYPSEAATPWPLRGLNEARFAEASGDPLAVSFPATESSLGIELKAMLISSAMVLGRFLDGFDPTKTAAPAKPAWPAWLHEGLCAFGEDWPLASEVLPAGVCGAGSEPSFASSRVSNS